MANYDYQCLKCKHTQEESHPMMGPIDIIICSKCKSNKMIKLVSVPILRFIGDWQTNDIHNKGK